jgi:arylsulfatase A-like enzyme
MPGPRKTKPISWGLREVETLDAVREGIKNYSNAKRRFFLTYVPATPHYPYDGIPAEFNGVAEKSNGTARGYKAKYLDSVLYMDEVITGIIDQLNECGILTNTLVVVTADHGEMLGEDGGPIGHGWAIRPELTNVPLIIIDPANSSYKINYTFGSQVDLLPTLLDVLGVQIPSDQLYEGCSLYKKTTESDRVIYLNSYAEFGIIRGNRFYWGTRESGADSIGSPLQRAYSISNSGTQTTFTRDEQFVSVPFSMSRFDGFQRNLLSHYHDYCPVFNGPQ